jgi:two-component system response regulator NreC
VTIRLVVADDHEIVRRGLRAVLERAPGFEVVGEATTGRETVNRAEQLRPDVLLMDVRMPEMSGIDAARTIAARCPRTGVVALSNHTDRRYVSGMIECGARGYVLKSSSYEELLRAVKLVAAGKRYLCSEVRGLLRAPSSLASGKRSVHGSLGVREQRVLQLVAEGRSSPEISGELGISRSTVDTHRRNLMRKLGVRGVAALTKYAIREGLIGYEG